MPAGHRPDDARSLLRAEWVTLNKPAKEFAIWRPWREANGPPAKVGTVWIQQLYPGTTLQLVQGDDRDDLSEDEEDDIRESFQDNPLPEGTPAAAGREADANEVDEPPKKKPKKKIKKKKACKPASEKVLQSDRSAETPEVGPSAGANNAEVARNQAIAADSLGDTSAEVVAKARKALEATVSFVKQAVSCTQYFVYKLTGACSTTYVQFAHEC
jgi:hypothetical protein